MTRDEWAAALNGRQYRRELSELEGQQAEADGVLIVFGASDDLMEFRGVITDEVDCYNGGEAFATAQGLLPRHEDDECVCPFCGEYEAQKLAAKIEAVWGEFNRSWTFKTDLPHATFRILEDGDEYCLGLVIDRDDLPGSISFEEF